MHADFEDIRFVRTQPVPMVAIRRVDRRTARLRLGSVGVRITDHGPEPIEALETLASNMQVQRSEYAKRTADVLNESAHPASFWAHWFYPEDGPHEIPDSDPYDDPGAWSRYLAERMPSDRVVLATLMGLQVQQWTMHAYSVLSFVQDTGIGSVSTRFVAARTAQELNALTDSIDGYVAALTTRYPTDAVPQAPTRF